jgi:hypothetical protein
MRHLIVLSMLVLSSLSVKAMADDQAQTVTAADTSPQCMTIQLDGKATTACFNLSDDQVQNLGVQPEAAPSTETQPADMEAYYGPRHHCEVRCIAFDHFGRCREWHRQCW